LNNVCFAPVVESFNSPNLHFSSPTLYFRNAASAMAFGAGAGRRFLGAVLPATIWAPPRFALLTIFCEAPFKHNWQDHIQHLAEIGPTGLLSMGMHSPLHDKGHPIFGVFVHGRSFLEFWTPKVSLLKSPGD
jgi:hypothetical protein